ncbi:MAG: hypothetical protein ACOX6N_03890 [Patescibacteria group bacterium]|jgi:hypothetical protein
MKENKRKQKILKKGNVLNDVTFEMGIAKYVKKDLLRSFILSLLAFLVIYALYYFERNPQSLNILLRR